MSLEFLWLAIFLTCFACIYKYRPLFGLGLFFALSPIYLWRLKIGILPTTAFELMFFVMLAQEILNQIKNPLKPLFFIKENKLFIFGLGLFWLGGILGIIFAPDIKKALGEWRAFYFEPIFLIYILSSLKERLGSKNPEIARAIYGGLTILLITTLALAFFQNQTGYLVEEGFRDLSGAWRATTWYGFPNGTGLIGLFAGGFGGSILIFQKNKKIKFIGGLILLAGLLNAYLARSTGGLIGIMSGAWLTGLFSPKTRKFTISLAILGMLIVFFSPPKIQDELFFRDRSGQIRLAMWQETFVLIKDRPLLPAGISGFAERIAPYHQRVNGEGIEIFHHPHNLFLTIYVNLGLLGFVGFILIILAFFKNLKNRGQWWSAMLSGIIFSILIAGLVDTPLIKNDWAMIFFATLALGLLKSMAEETPPHE